MCARTAPGRGRRASSRESALSKRSPRPGPVTRPEQPHAAVVGQRAVDGAVREDDELVDARGEGAQLGDRRPEHRARGVDLLRDDDEPHALRASTARPTSSATRSAYSSGVYVHDAASAPAALAEALAPARGRRGPGRARRRCRPAGRGRRGARSRRPTTTSGIPPARAPTTARPRHSASSTTRGVPSERDARSSSQESSNAVTTSDVSSRRSHVTRPGRSRTSASRTSR